MARVKSKALVRRQSAKAEAAATGKKKKAPVRRSVDATDKKPHRWRRGTVALRDIRRYQKSTEPLTRLAPFERGLRAQIAELKDECRLQRSALLTDQQMKESMYVELMKLANTFALHTLRVHDPETERKEGTKKPKDSGYRKTVAGLDVLRAAEVKGFTIRPEVREMVLKAAYLRSAARQPKA